jgi:hypothetical protein
MNKDTILYILTIIHIITWLSLIYGIIYTDTEFHILYTIPIFYLSYILFNECVLDKVEDLFGKDPNKAVIVYDYIARYVFNFSFQNPLSAQGMLILGLIIGTYILKEKNKKL